MNIAICDDDRLMSGQIEKLVEQVFHGETSKYNTEVFFRGIVYWIFWCSLLIISICIYWISKWRGLMA